MQTFPFGSFELRIGDLVHVDSPSRLAMETDGRLVGFYAGDSRRIVVMPPSGKAFVAEECDVSLIPRS